MEEDCFEQNEGFVFQNQDQFERQFRQSQLPSVLTRANNIHNGYQSEININSNEDKEEVQSGNPVSQQEERKNDYVDIIESIEKNEDNVIEDVKNKNQTKKNITLEKRTKNEKQNHEKARRRHHISCLGVLTTRFMEKLGKSSRLILDINELACQLGVEKRRIYDVINVFEGIGYIEKIHKNKIKWVGGTEDPELHHEITTMQKELNELEIHEKTMDCWIRYLHEELKNAFNQQADSQKYAYLTHEDFKNLCKNTSTESGETMFIITAPKGTTVEAPLLESEIQYEYPYQLYLNSKNGEMEVFLCSDETEQQEVKETQQSQSQMKIPPLEMKPKQKNVLKQNSSNSNNNNESPNQAGEEDEQMNKIINIAQNNVKLISEKPNSGKKDKSDEFEMEQPKKKNVRQVQKKSKV